MTRALAAGLAVALTASVAAAQPLRVPAGAPMQTQEKAGTKLENDASTGPVVSAAAEREARIDFLAGNEHLNNGLFMQAVEKYTEALAHWDHPAIHYNIALALINLDRPLEVHDHLTKAIAYGPDPLDKDKYDHAREYLRLVEGQVADIEVSCDVPGARVAVDGSVVFVAPGRYAAKVRAGKHSFVAEKRGYVTRATAPFVASGEKYRIDLALYTGEELTRYRRRWSRAWIPYGVIGAGALFGLAGGGLELSARSSFRDLEPRSPGATRRPGIVGVWRPPACWTCATAATSSAPPASSCTGSPAARSRPARRWPSSTAAGRIRSASRSSRESGSR